VDLVRRVAQGGAVLEDGSSVMYGGIPADRPDAEIRYKRAARDRPSGGAVAAMSSAEPARAAFFGAHSDDNLAFDELALETRAMQEEAAAAAIGDFSVWTAPNPLHIP